MEKIILNKNDNTFNIGGIEFIKVTEENGEVSAVAKDIVFRSEFGKNNNFGKSEILEKLNKEILPKIAEAIGEENILEHEVDLTSLDGLKTYGSIKSKISIPTFDFYRANVDVFDKHKVEIHWWLATPDTTPEHLNDTWCRCVSPVGYFNNVNCNYVNGVRPFLKFVSSIFVSDEE